MRVFILSLLISLLPLTLALPSDEKSLTWGSSASKSKNCPPKNFKSTASLDVNAYLGKWYVQEQQSTRYLREVSNYCVTANYTLLDSKTIQVINYANDEEVNGKSRGVELRAIIKDKTTPSKLSVGPKFLPDFLKGPYWVVATGPISEDTGLYSWAVIIAGPPTYEGVSGKCYAGETRMFTFSGDSEGLWIFSRKQVEDESVVAKIKEIMQNDLGLDTSVLNKVVQEGCLYQINE